MVDSSIAWRLFHVNWIPIALMAGILLLGVVICGFSLEPVAAAIPTAIAVALIVYLYAFAKADRADPKLILSLGAIITTALNLLMIAATPVIGTHYVIDVIGGVALAAICIILCKYVMGTMALSSSATAQAGQSATLVPALD